MSQNSGASARRFQVRFNGELLAGFTKESVIVNVAKAYNVSPDEIAKWFAEGGVTLREEATAEELSGLEGFFNQHGLRLEVINLQEESESFKPALDDNIIDTHSGSEAPHSNSQESQENDNVGARNHDSNDSNHGHFDNNGQADNQQTSSGNPHDIALEELKQTLTQLKVFMMPKELEGFVPASLGKRTIAFILDYLIISFLTFMLLYILGTLGIVDMTPFQEYFALAESTLSVEDLMANSALQPILEQVILTFSIWVSVTFILYFALMEKFYGASLGKKVFNIRVYSLRTGSQLAWNTVLIRTFLFYLGINFLPAIPFIGIFLFLASVLWATRDHLFRRTVYDNLSGTVVGSVPHQR